MSETPEQDNLTNEGIPATGHPEGGARPGVSDGKGNVPDQQPTQEPEKAAE